MREQARAIPEVKRKGRRVNQFQENADKAPRYAPKNPSSSRFTSNDVVRTTAVRFGVIAGDTAYR